MLQYVYAPSLAACSQPASGSLVLCIRYASQDGLWVVTCDSRGNAREHLPKGAKYSYSWTQFLQYVATGVLVERVFQCMMASSRRDGQGQNSVDRQGGALIDLQRHDADAAVLHSSRRYGPCDWSEAPLLMGHLELLYAVPPQLATLVSRLVQLERLKPTEKSLLGTLEPETLLMLTRTASCLCPPSPRISLLLIASLSLAIDDFVTVIEALFTNKGRLRSLAHSFGPSLLSPPHSLVD